MIEVLEGFPDDAAALACHGHVTRNDYGTVLVSRIEAALAAQDRFRLIPGELRVLTSAGAAKASSWIVS